MSHRDHHHDIAPIREKIKEKSGGKSGREFWRSLDEYADTERFREFLHREFPALNAPETDPAMLDPQGRRNFLKLMSASLALAGLTACTRQPKEYLVPYVRTPEGLVPGKPQYYATAMTMGGVATGLLVESHEGRPTKIEGNSDHPSTKGGTTVFDQASVLQLYDPDRSQTALFLGDPRTWGEFLNGLRAAMDAQRNKQGSGLRILTETISSPTFAEQMQKLITEFPQAKWHVYEPAGRDGARAGSNLCFGQVVNAVYKFDQANIVLSLDADFLTNGPGSVRYARDFIDRRRLANGNREMNRLYVVESTLTTTGGKADNRIPLRATEVDSFARAVARALGVSLGTSGEPGLLSDEARKFAQVVANDLKVNSGKSIVIAGEHQPAQVHAIAHAINIALGNIDHTVVYTDPIDANPVNQHSSITELVRDLNAERVDLLVIIGANPVYNTPIFKDEKTGKDLKFVDAMKKAALRVHMGLYNDETAANCHWHVAETHYLESWSDARAYDGTVSIVQPLIVPLYSGKSPHELIAAMSNQAGKLSYDIVRDYWKTRMGENFEQSWKQALHDGFIPNTALPAKSVTLNPGWTSALQPVKAGRYEIVFRLDPCVHDGRFANNSWLQELPKPINKVTWDNFALISEKMANELGLNHEKEWRQGSDAKMIGLTNNGHYLSLPVWVQPGHPDNSVTVFLGYGRSRAGSVGSNKGFNTNEIRTIDASWIATDGVRFEAASGSYLLASTQEHFNIDTSHIDNDAFLKAGEDLSDRQIIRTATLEEYKKDQNVIRHSTHVPEKKTTMYPPWAYDKAKTSDGRELPLYAWGMSIDMNACIGCNACIVACVSENNIAVVGKDLVHKGRSMHWLRIDIYFRGGTVNPQVYFQPMLCQHCELAPCELVCPVNATVHDAEGLNVQVYNRCVGTRYCSNNCPYKVRRFNYLLYGDWDTPSLKNVRNPEVTIRSRGVMEKCTFCIQRITNAKIESEKQHRRVKDGEIMTACQTACPTDAIIFGDTNDPESRVSRLKKEPRDYLALGDLNTRPRTSYLAQITNPNAELGEPHKKSGEVKHG
jgi:MoCo/4Fe-4S cofactor protein with predicted Tat translocation signal